MKRVHPSPDWSLSLPQSAGLTSLYIARIEKERPELESKRDRLAPGARRARTARLIELEESRIAGMARLRDFMRAQEVARFAEIAAAGERRAREHAAQFAACEMEGW